MQKLRHEFKNKGDQLVGYWHLPDAASETNTVPAVLMGHGLATEWHFGTPGYIQNFVDNGYAVFNFDYRHFGESEGTPRQLVDIESQLSDWEAALEQVKNQPCCDPSTIVLWGSSLGGGLALSIAAKHTEVAGVMVQVPHCDASKGIKYDDIGKTLWLFANVLTDSLCKAFRLPAKYVALLGDNLSGYGVLDYPGWKAGYEAIVTPGSDWQNRIPARSLMTISKFNPIETAQHIKCPALIIAASDDPGTPADAAKETAEKIPNARYREYEGDHFDAYTGSPLFQQNIQWQLEFLREVAPV